MICFKKYSDMLRYFFCCLFVIALGAYCAGELLAQTVVTKDKITRKKIQALPGDAVKSFNHKEDYVYEPAGKKDPFFPILVDEKDVPVSAIEVAGTDSGVPLTPLEMYELSQLKLVAIMKFGDRDLAMVEDPEGKGHTLYIGTLIGKNKGKVLRMEEGRVLIEEKYRKRGKTISVIEELFISSREEK